MFLMLLGVVAMHRYFTQMCMLLLNCEFRTCDSFYECFVIPCMYVLLFSIRFDSISLRLSLVLLPTISQQPRILVVLLLNVHIIILFVACLMCKSKEMRFMIAISVQFHST